MTRSVRSYGAHLVVAAAILVSAAGCGGSGDSPPSATASSSPQTPQAQVHSQSLDTAQLLEQARRSSEIADPYAVDSGALTLTDTSDSTDPLVFVAL
jgi:hypothetical protein